MAEFRFADSPYRFTDPVRYFKANDPYYFEVDNIPIKQLEENTLWLRDQLQKNVLEIQLADIKRSDIAELKPYASGGDRLVRVKPGRYSARINDVASKEPLQFLTQILGESIGDMDVFQALAANDGTNFNNSVLKESVDKLKDYLSDSALHMNGLSERAFTWPSQTVDLPSVYVGSTTDALEYTSTEGPGQLGPTIVAQALLWAKSQNSAEGKYLIPSYDYTDNSIGFGKLPLLENHFIKAWRGVARTAIVDVPEELTIEVPPFDKNDFFYLDSAGNKVVVDGVASRVDMVFLYTKPVDASSADVFRGGSVQTITKSELGIVRGAGIGQSFKGLGTISSEYKPKDLFDAEGNPQIAASPSDQLDTNTGFDSVIPAVRGSFPSPDDLLNIAPLLSERLEDDSLELIGQSILPLAYIFVRANADTDTAGTEKLLESDVVDIRPFFRTAELTYNERAGLAASMPQLSLANPAVGKAQLDYEIRDLKKYTDARLKEITSGGEDRIMGVVAGGFIFGGWLFGPEAALYDFNYPSFSNNSSPIQDTQNFVQQKYLGVNPSYGLIVPDYPDWDIARWAEVEGQPGTYHGDYLTVLLGDVKGHVGGSYKGQVFAGGLDSNGAAASRFKNFSHINHQLYDIAGGDPNGVLPQNYMSWLGGTYISKKIKFDRDQASWMLDYTVDLNFVNCAPLTSQGHMASRHDQAKVTGWWVEKGWDEFTIYVCYATPHSESVAPPDFPAPYKVGNTTVHARGDNKFGGGILVMVEDMLYSQTAAFPDVNSKHRDGYAHNPSMGTCTYPTINWKMTGIPSNDAPFWYTNLNSKNPTIKVK